MKLSLIVSLALAVSAASAAPPEATPVAVDRAASPAPSGGTPVAADPTAFADAVAACAPATRSEPHPFAKGFIIDHAIAGEADGRCDYSQTMPGGMHMACRLGEEGRASLAQEFRDQAAGSMRGGTGQQKAWTQDCEIVTADGKRLPMQGG